MTLQEGYSTQSLRSLSRCSTQSLLQQCQQHRQQQRQPLKENVNMQRRQAHTYCRLNAHTTNTHMNISSIRTHIIRPHRVSVSMFLMSHVTTSILRPSQFAPSPDVAPTQSPSHPSRQPVSQSHPSTSQSVSRPFNPFTTRTHACTHACSQHNAKSTAIHLAQCAKKGHAPPCSAQFRRKAREHTTKNRFSLYFCVSSYASTCTPQRRHTQ